ncbi:hypothetical protein KA005_58730, partial [bacterium]|nr:hypothetical protein [bacterium]
RGLRTGCSYVVEAMDGRERPDDVHGCTNVAGGMDAGSDPRRPHQNIILIYIRNNCSLTRFLKGLCVKPYHAQQEPSLFSEAVFCKNQPTYWLGVIGVV